MRRPSKTFEFPVPKELRTNDAQARIYGISIERDSFVIEFVDREDKVQPVKSFITGDKQNDLEALSKLLESKLSFFFDSSVVADVTGKLVNVIDGLYTDGAAHAIERIKKLQKAEAAELDGQQQQQQEKEKEIHYVKKYSNAAIGSLYEAVIINDEPVFVQPINSGYDIALFKEIDTGDMKLLPPSKLAYPPDSYVEFSSEEELREYVINARSEKDTLYRLYKDVRQYFTKDYFVDTEPRNSTVLALYTITSYFQDKFSTTVYIWLIGDNGSGKNSILITYSWLGYRVFYMAGASGANICEYLGTVEEGQGTIAEDELGDLDYDAYKRLLYMTGYASGGSVPKVLDGNTKGREQVYFRSYCQKMSASENLPSIKYSKGVLDREFIVKCVKGSPKYNVKSTKKRTKTPEVLRLINELQTLRKRLFAFRLVHFDDVIEDIRGLNISGRALELTDTALQLFHNYKTTEEDNKIFNEDILPALSSFLGDRLGRRNDSLEAKLYPIIRMMIDAQGSETLDNNTIYNTVCSELEAREIPGKPDVFILDDLGITITRSKIMKVLREKFKATPTIMVLPEDGSRRRAHTIPKETLERMRASYEDEWEITILSTEDMSAQAAQVLGEYREDISAENQEVKPETREGNKQETTPKDPENGDNNGPHITPEPALPAQRYPIEECISRAMLDKEGKNNKGYFTLEDFVFELQLLPNECWTHDQAEQTLYQLLYEEKIEEIEPDKYRPVSKNNGQGGGA